MVEVLGPKPNRLDRARGCFRPKAELTSDRNDAALMQMVYTGEVDWTQIWARLRSGPPVREELLAGYGHSA